MYAIFTADQCEASVRVGLIISVPLNFLFGLLCGIGIAVVAMSCCIKQKRRKIWWKDAPRQSEPAVSLNNMKSHSPSPAAPLYEDMAALKTFKPFELEENVAYAKVK